MHLTAMHSFYLLIIKSKELLILSLYIYIYTYFILQIHSCLPSNNTHTQMHTHTETHTLHTQTTWKIKYYPTTTMASRSPLWHHATTVWDRADTLCKQNRHPNKFPCFKQNMLHIYLRLCLVIIFKISLAVARQAYLYK